MMYLSSVSIIGYYLGWENYKFDINLEDIGGWFFILNLNYSNEF